MTELSYEEAKTIVEMHENSKSFFRQDVGGAGCLIALLVIAGTVGLFFSLIPGLLLWILAAIIYIGTRQKSS